MSWFDISKFKKKYYKNVYNKLITHLIVWVTLHFELYTSSSMKKSGTIYLQSYWLRLNINKYIFSNCECKKRYMDEDYFLLPKHGLKKYSKRQRWIGLLRTPFCRLRPGKQRCKLLFSYMRSIFKNECTNKEELHAF